MVKKIENYTKPQLPNRREFLNTKNIVTIISTGLLTITLGCSGNAKLVDSADKNKQIKNPTKSLASNNQPRQLVAVPVQDSILAWNDSTIVNYPNPFMPNTSIPIIVEDSTSPQHVIVDMYNVKGQLVRSLVNEYFETGKHNVNWDGLGDAGKSVESGIYFYKVTINGVEMDAKKMILMK